MKIRSRQQTEVYEFMKTTMKFVCFVLMVLFFGAMTAAGTALAEDNYVRVAIQGTNVNLRPQPRAAGSVIAQMNTGNVFIAEKSPIVLQDDKSEWYKIVLAVDSKTNKITVLSERDSRFKANMAFVHANYATVSPLAKGDMEAIMGSPEGVGYSLDSIYGTWSYVYSTEGDEETPLYLHELEISPPSLEINKDNTMVFFGYEGMSKGTLVQTGACSYNFIDVKIESEGGQYHKDIAAYLIYVPKSGLFQYTFTNEHTNLDVHHYFAYDGT